MTEIQMLGNNIKSRRLALGLTQKQLAKKAKIHINYLGEIERGVRNPSFNNIMKISKALKVPMALLFTENEDWLHNGSYLLKQTSKGAKTTPIPDGHSVVKIIDNHND